MGGYVEHFPRTNASSGHVEHLHDAHTQPLVKWNTLQYSHKTFGYVECISDASNETPVMCFEWLRMN